MQLSVRLPIYDPSAIQPAKTPTTPLSAVSSGFGKRGSGSSVAPAPHAVTALVDDQTSIATWEMWDLIRSICEYHPRLSLSTWLVFMLSLHYELTFGCAALDLTPPLPLALEVLNQWVAEPTRYIFLPASSFIANAKGYPVLPKGTQSFIRDIMKVSVVLSHLYWGTILIYRHI